MTTSASFLSSSANDYVYLDWAATAPLCPAAAEVFKRVLGADDPLTLEANPNSLHSPGRAAFSALEKARADLAAALGARRPDELIFCSGATEADNLALRGLISAQCDRRRRRGERDFVPHVITSAIEHDAVRAPLKELASQGCELTQLAPDRSGVIAPSRLAEAMRPNTVLVSLMAVSNEIGSVQPVSELAAVAHEGGALFHSDGVQALGKIPVSCQAWGVDAASFSAHKVGGPKGMGVLYLRASTPLTPQILGGGQESGRRSGTQNLLGAMSFAAAATAAVEAQAHEAARERALRDRLYQALTRDERVRATVEVPQGSERFAPHVVSLLVPGWESETLILQLDRLGYGVSGGSACSSHSLEPSAALLSLGISRNDARCSLRISLGPLTTDSEIERFIRDFDRLIGREPV